MRACTDGFLRLFETSIARTEYDVRLAKHLRYLAYCEDRHYLDSRAYPDACEQDADDPRSVHAILRYRPTGAPIGSVRLILPPGQFPVERATGAALLDHVQDLDRMRTAEISRICLTRHYLPPACGWGSASHRERRTLMQYAILGLFRGVVSLSRAWDVRHWCGMMSPAVVRGSQRLGVHFRELGSPIRFFGLKQPIANSVRDVLHRMQHERPDLYALAIEPL